MSVLERYCDRRSQIEKHGLLQPVQNMFPRSLLEFSRILALTVFVTLLTGATTAETAGATTADDLPTIIGDLSAQKLGAERWAVEWKRSIANRQRENLEVQQDYLRSTGGTGGLLILAHERDLVAEIGLARRFYGRARESYEGLIVQMRLQLAIGDSPTENENFNDRLSRATSAADRFIEAAEYFVNNPEAPLDLKQMEEKENLVGLIGEAIGPLIVAAKELWIFYAKSAQQTRERLISGIATLHWKKFDEI